MTPEVRARVLADLGSWRARTVLVVLRAPRSAEAVEGFTAVLGVPPRVQQGVAVWAHV